MNDLKRYVLTKDNRIINKNDKRIKKIAYSIDKTETYIYLECDSKTPEAIFDCEKFYYATEHLVVKQSDNVFDLIEVGDLVEEGDFNEIYKVKIFDNGNDYFRNEIFDKYNGDLYVKYEACDDEYYSYVETLRSINIVKIFKPNEKGDYIKVWEVNNNE